MAVAKFKGHEVVFPEFAEAERWAREAVKGYVKGQYDDDYISAYVKHIDLDGLTVIVEVRRYFDEAEAVGNTDEDSAE